MPRVNPSTISAKEKKELLSEFWGLVYLLENQEEIENFFRDLLSESEVVMLARRIRIAKLLLEGKSYEEIREIMKTSHVTINNVQRWLQINDNSYKKAAPILEKELTRQRKFAAKKIEEKTPFTFEWLKKRYPLHFLIFNLIDAFEAPKKPKSTRKR